MRKIHLYLKRIIDIVGSGIGLLFVSPLLIMTSILIKITMPGPIFFKQERVGQFGKEFEILKFRSMKVDKQAELSHNIKKDSERLTTFGRIIRRLKIDELPQLINVLKGDMSLVGPRPTFKEQVDAYTEREKRRLNMKPGMTGLAQVNGNTTISWAQRIDYDLEYIDKFSLFLDCKILLKTIGVVLFGEDKFRK